ncbi:MAG: hypothetical protein A2V90_00320 [Gammaproteobacteria bacterium RBG_16_57_12]|nr:MAG: hypothetical protein A2V90_00320 [Gammaproteobacteria bacterium RBG_16_57_12]
MSYPNQSLLAICLLAVPSLALTETLGSPPLVVSATRTAQAADETLAPVIIITRDDIERSQAGDVANLLRLHAGLDIGRNGGPGQPVSLFIRGTESNHTLVMIDGVKINPGTIGGAALHNITPEMIERIEIVKGPRSALYGSEAIGGVINIITRPGEAARQWQVTAGGGSFGTRQAGAAMNLHNESLRAGVALHHLSTDGFSPITAAKIDRGHDNTTMKAYLGRQWGGVDVEASHWQASGRTEYLTFDYVTLGYNPADEDFTNSVSAVKVSASPATRWTSTLHLSNARDDLDQNQVPDFSHTSRNTLDWQNDLQLTDRQLVTAGITLTREDTEALVYGSGFDQTTDVNAAYLQDDITLDRHHVLAAVRHTDHENFGGHDSWDLEYGYALDDATRLTAAVGTGFRAPDSTDRFGYGGNTLLRPERSRNIEVGMKRALGEQQNAYLNVFHNTITDLIDYFDPDGWLGSLPGQNENIAKARIRGVEVGHHWRSGPYTGRVEVIAQQPRNETTGEPLPRRAEHSLTAALAYQGVRCGAGIDVVAQDERKDTAYSTAINAGYGIVNLNASYALGKAWRLSGKVENLFDKSYALADGYNTAERSFFVELRYSGSL